MSQAIDVTINERGSMAKAAKSITIDGVEYVPKGMEAPKNSNLRIG